MINLDLNNKQKVYSKTVTAKDNRMQIELLSSKSPYKLTLKEYRFLSSINSKTEINYKQRDWLKIIYKKLLKYAK
tara:strand:+ start:611 stop:835 length:225 start_codon:yes stop_codon:yes gene_type:complete